MSATGRAEETMLKINLFTSQSYLRLSKNLRKHFPPPRASCNVLRFSNLGTTDLSHLTFSHRLSSCDLPKPHPLLCSLPHCLPVSCSLLARPSDFCLQSHYPVIFYHFSSGAFLSTGLAVGSQPSPFLSSARESREPQTEKKYVASRGTFSY